MLYHRPTAYSACAFMQFPESSHPYEIDRQIERPADGWMDRWAGEWTGGRTDRQTVIKVPFIAKVVCFFICSYIL